MTVTKKVYSFIDLNKDLNDFYVCLKNKNFTDTEISKIIIPLTSKLSGENKSVPKIFYIMLFMFGFSFLIYLLTYWEVFYWNLTALSRIFLIKILPIYDWRYLKYQECLLEKYNFHKTMVDNDFAFECDLCESLRTFDEIAYDNDREDSELIERLLKLDRPVLLRGGIEHWIQGSSNDFIDILKEDNAFALSIPCKISSNIHNRNQDFIEAHALISKTDFFDNFFIQFQNCEKAAIRVFRNITTRPSILPDTLSPVTLNWLLWSRNYNSPSFKKVDLTEKYTVIGQIAGHVTLRLLPRKNCKDTCAVLEGTLSENEFIVLTSLWDVEYKPFDEGDNIGAILEIRG